MGSMSVSSCRYRMFVSCVHHVAVLNDALCMTCSLLMWVEDARGDHMEEAYSSKFIANYIKGRKAYTTYKNHTSKHLPILISLQTDVTINPIQHRFSINRPTVKNEKRSCMPSFLKQHHTTYPLEDTDSTQSRLQQRYWKR